MHKLNRGNASPLLMWVAVACLFVAVLAVFGAFGIDLNPAKPAVLGVFLWAVAEALL